MATVQQPGTHSTRDQDYAPWRPRARDRMRAWIDREWAEQFAWYFGQGGHGSFMRSTTGAQIEQLIRFGQAAPVCERCGGDPVTGRAGSGFVDSRTGRAPEHVDGALGALLVSLLGADLPSPVGDQLCRDCHGYGVVIDKPRPHARGEQTVGYTGDEGVIGGYELEVGEVARFGQVGAKVAKVAALQGETPAVVALSLWFAPEYGGDLQALWQMTPPGKKLLKKKIVGLHPVEFFRTECEAQSKSPDRARGALIDAADDRAVKIWEATCEVVAAATGGGAVGSAAELARELRAARED